MKKIEEKELKELQLDILNDVHVFCINNDIKYSLSFGSLLGAIRHKGYIPWDDDIDIMMPREDYERFINTYKHDYFKIATSSTMSDYFHPYAKVYNTQTIVQEFVEYKSSYGINIDVFPIDKMPDNNFTLKRMFFRKKILNLIYNLKMVSINKNRSFFKNRILSISHILLRPIKMNVLVNKMECISKKYDNRETSRSGIFTPADNTLNSITDNNVFAEYIEVQFEGRYFCIVKDFNSLLHAFYGDYMKLPPLEKRITHHSFDAWWK